MYSLIQSIDNLNNNKSLLLNQIKNKGVNIVQDNLRINDLPQFINQVQYNCPVDKNLLISIYNNTHLLKFDYVYDGNATSLYRNNIETFEDIMMGNNITSINYTFSNCYNLTGSPVCGPNVTGMVYAYANCYNLTGNPVCGPNVTNMYYAYYNCSNLTGSPVCGDNVTNMYYAYYNCSNLSADFFVCGPKVSSLGGTFLNVTNTYGNHYYNLCNKITNVRDLYKGRSNDKRLNIFINSSIFTNTRLFRNSSIYSIVGKAITWATGDDATLGTFYYNTKENIYLYNVTS